MKKISHNIVDFDKIILEDYYYIDKTKYIPTVESFAPFILFVRPIGMGKSLFVNMLMSYYDIEKADLYDELFGKLWIGHNKTVEANTFLVLKLDFSKVNGIGKELIENFNAYFSIQLQDFFGRYRKYFTPNEIERVLSLVDIGLAITRMVDLAKLKGLPVYLFLDEYDNFCNTILASKGFRAHEEITCGLGFYSYFFRSCKGAFDKIFMTGITPVTYDDLTSGFNIADVVALEPSFDKMIGVTESELREMLDYYISQGQIKGDPNQIISAMKPWYGNFCFSEECYGVEPSLYNTSSVIRHVNSLISYGRPPLNMVDENAHTDYKKLDFLMIADDLYNRGRRIEIFNEICAEGYVTGIVKDQFSAADCGDVDNFKSMLFYYGTLTLGGLDDNFERKLIVPNKNMAELYLQYMVRIANLSVEDFGKDWQTLEDKFGEWGFDE